MGVLLRKKFTTKEMIAAIIDLHVNKYITIDQDLIIRLNDGMDNSTLDEHQKFLLTKLKEIENKKIEKQLMQKFFNNFFYTLRKKIFIDLEKHKPFKLSPLKILEQPKTEIEKVTKKILIPILIAVIILSAPLLLIADYQQILLTSVNVMVVSLLIIDFVPLIYPFAFTARSPEGMQLAYEIEGFKHYLETSELERYQKSTLQDRYKYAGYGIALGVKSPELDNFCNIVDEAGSHGYFLRHHFPWKIFKWALIVMFVAFVYGRIADFLKNL